ncbi:cupin domain-containing protein [Anaeromyxobacter sp. SG17]|uniref:cupin domain-containing protein n=1 Tax=Anaeromyxobacter sp. SG17 TaxID=2925405 RepID=UPI001F55B047|nr:cupin domain-containing protein [Anaeromyxobacter sp. SG17]
MSENTPLPPPRDLLVRAADRARLQEEAARHPWNPRSEIHGYMLGRKTGLTRIGVNLLRVPAGKESFVFHRHLREEEFAFVLSGKGVVDIGDETFEIGPGDFLGFPAGSHPHNLRNTGAEDLVYLSGGENRQADFAEFPRDGKVMVRIGRDVTIYPSALGEPFWPATPAAEGE